MPIASMLRDKRVLRIVPSTLDSTSKCNRQRCTYVEEYLVRSSKAEGLSWAVVKLIHHVLDLSLANSG